jgi:V/A-type H+-transporting ATPase subunit E
LAAEGLLAELEERRKKLLSNLESEYQSKRQQIEKPLQSELTSISETAQARATELSQRERVRIEGAGKLQAKKSLFDATEKMLENNLAALKDAFAKYATTDQYDDLLSRMVKYASKRLGGQIGLICRKNDAEKLSKIGARVISAELNSIGGFKAESNDGSLELDLTFEEILRSHEEDVRAIILGANEDKS